MVSVALVDDHPLMVESISSLLSNTEGFQVVGTGAVARDIFDLCALYQPQIMIVDLSILGDVYESIAASIKISPLTKVITFTAATGVAPAIRALDAGTRGYVLKGSSSQELIQAIRAVHSGEVYITQTFASRVIAALRDSSLRRKVAKAVEFSVREEQIVRLLLRGNTNKQIAIVLKISEKTVKRYMTVLMQKLHARNRVEVVIAVQRLGRQDQTVVYS